MELLLCLILVAFAIISAVMSTLPMNNSPYVVADQEDEPDNMGITNFDSSALDDDY